MGSRFIKPKRPLNINTNWKVSKDTKLLIKYYTEYTGYTENEVVDMLLSSVTDDEDFQKWLNTKRSKKKVESVINNRDNPSENTSPVSPSIDSNTPKPQFSAKSENSQIPEQNNSDYDIEEIES